MLTYTNYLPAISVPRLLEDADARAAIKERARQDFAAFVSKPARVWRNTPDQVASVKIDMLRRQFAPKPRRVRLPKPADRPHILPLSRRDLAATWAYLLHKPQEQPAQNWHVFQNSPEFADEGWML